MSSHLNQNPLMVGSSYINLHNTFSFILFTNYFTNYYIVGEEEWFPDPNDPFAEPEWVTAQRLAWLAKKKQKE